MNQARRLRIAKIFSKLTDLESNLEELEEEEQDAFDNLPESIAATERGDQMQEFVEVLRAAASQITEARSDLSEMLNTETAIA
tara:strand:- start:141 stop:389 length:249 start_codon:yes stop_codon:yes gene_type:complete